MRAAFMRSLFKSNAAYYRFVQQNTTFAQQLLLLASVLQDASCNPCREPYFKLTSNATASKSWRSSGRPKSQAAPKVKGLWAIIAALNALRVRIELRCYTQQFSTGYN